MPLSMKTYLALLWGISVLFSTECVSLPITEVSGVTSTAEPAVTTQQLISAHEVHNKTEPQPDATHRPTHQPAEVIAAATADTPVSTSSPTEETEETMITHRISNDNTPSLVTMNTVAPTESSSGPRLPQTAAATTAVGEAQLSHSTAIAAPASTTASETAKPPEEKLHGESLTTSSDMTAPATTSATTSSSPHLTPTINPEVTSELFPTTSTAPNTTQAAVIIQDHSTLPASATTTTANPTSETTPAFDPTAVPFATSEIPSPGTVVSSTSQLTFKTRTHIPTSQFPDSAGSSSTPAASFSTDSDTTTTAAVSTSPAGILIPIVPKRGPIPMTRSTPATTTAPQEVSKSQPGTEVQTCSTKGIVKKCLIVIASLAALATIFMVSTIVLCTKLSAKKYKVKRPQQATEMMCISALLPERTYNYSRQRNPVNNGVLVMHIGGDSDEDERDTLTLSSFLPENDRLA